jgi:hypothetical protein
MPGLVLTPPAGVPACHVFLVLQLSTLTNLHTLDLQHAGYAGTSLGALCHLKQLRRLKLHRPRALPACLAELTQLETLEIEMGAFPDPEEISLLEGALPHLQGLTCLVLSSEALRRHPPAVAQLGRLQRCLVWINNGLNGGPAPDHCLPPGGACLGSLRWLGLSWAAALQSAAVLAAAQRLEYLCVLDAVGVMATPALAHAERWAAFWRWAACHPSLRCLGLKCEDADSHHTSPRFYFTLLDAVLDLQRRRPALLVRRKLQPEGNDPSFWAELLSLRDIPA